MRIIYLAPVFLFLSLPHPSDAQSPPLPPPEKKIEADPELESIGRPQDSAEMPIVVTPEQPQAAPSIPPAASPRIEPPAVKPPAPAAGVPEPQAAPALKAEGPQASAPSDSTGLWALTIIPTHFRFAGFTSVSSGGGSYFSLMLSWNPTVWFNPYFGLKVQIGATVLRAKDKSNFLATETSLLLAGRPIRHLTIEAGGGAQSWLNRIGTSPLFSLNVSTSILDEYVGRGQELFGGYSGLFISGDYHHQGRLGWGIRL